jgi:hypothetical protein
MAEDNGLEVIPLVQTFGHLEHLLKLDEFRHLREVDQEPMLLNLSGWNLRRKVIYVNLPFCLAQPSTDYQSLGLSSTDYPGLSWTSTA